MPLPLRGDPLAGLFDDMDFGPSYRTPRLPSMAAPRRRSIFYEPPAPRAAAPEAADTSIWDDLAGGAWDATRGILNVGSAAVGAVAGLGGYQNQGARKLLADLPGGFERFLPDTVEGYQRALKENADGASDNGARDLSWSEVLQTAPGAGQVFAESFLPGRQETAAGRILKTTGALAGDIALDPLNLASGGVAGAAKAAKEGKLLTAGARALGSAPAGAAYAPDIIEGTYGSGKEAVRAFREGRYGDAAEAGTQALLTGSLGALMGKGALDDIASMRGRPAMDPGLAAVDDVVTADAARRSAPQDELQALDDLIGEQSRPFVAPDEAFTPPLPDLWDETVPRGFEPPTAPVDPIAERAFLTPDPEAAALAEQARLARDFQQERTAAQAAAEAAAPPPPVAPMSPGEAMRARLEREGALPPRQPAPEAPPAAEAPRDDYARALELAQTAGGRLTLGNVVDTLGVSPSRARRILSRLQSEGVVPRVEQAIPTPEMSAPDVPAAVPVDAAGNRVLPGQEDWTPEKRAAVHQAADAIVGDAVAGQKAQPAGRKPVLTGPAANSVEGFYGINSAKSGTALAELPYSPREMQAALEKDKGNPVELEIHDAIARDERVAQQLDQPAPEIPDLGIAERGADRRVPPAPDLPADMERRRLERRGQIAQEAGLDVEHPAVARILDAEERAEAATTAADTDPLTGLGSRRAYEAAATSAKAAVSFDVAGLKWFNDTHGHGAGDSLLKALGDAIREQPEVKGFRTGGDEFFLHAETPEAAEVAARNIQERLAQSTITATTPDGTVVSWKGGRVDYGVGVGQERADAALLAERARAEAAGERSPRGTRPQGLVEVSPARDAVRDQAPAPDRVGPEREPGAAAPAEAGPPLQLDQPPAAPDPPRRTLPKAFEVLRSQALERGLDAAQVDRMLETSNGRGALRNYVVETPVGQRRSMVLPEGEKKPATTPPGSKLFDDTAPRALDRPELEARQAEAIAENPEAADAFVEAAEGVKEAGEKRKGRQRQADADYKAKRERSREAAKLFDGQSALNRMRERGARANDLGSAAAAGVGALRDVATYGASRIEDFFRGAGRLPDFGAWAREMTRALVGVVPNLGRHIKAVWDEAVKLFNERRTKPEAIEAPKVDAAEAKTAPLARVDGEQITGSWYGKPEPPPNTATTADKWLEAWRAGLVSSPGTLFVSNPLGNMVEQIVRLGETGTSALVDSLIGGSRTRMDGEAVREFAGAVSGMSRSIRQFGTDLTDALKLAPEKFDADLPADRQGGAIEGDLGRFVRIPFRILQAGDALFKGIGGEAELYKLAWREAGGDKAKFDRLIKAPTASMLDQVSKSRKERTYQNPNAMAESLVNLRNKHKWLNVVMPFVTTPANIASITIERSPLGFVKAKKAYDAYRTAKARGASFEELGKLRGDAVDALARPLLGTLLMGAFAAFAKAGALTGSGPTDPKERELLRETGWQPYSFVLGPEGNRTYIPFNRLEPVSSLMGFAADMSEAKDAKDAGDMFDKGLGSIVENLTSKTYLRGIADASNLVSDPKRFASQYTANLAGSIVPNVVKKAAQSIDSTQRDTRASTSGLSGIPERVGKSIVAGIPFASMALPERRASTGETIERPGNAATRLLSPVQPTTEKADRKLERTYLEVGFKPSAPGRTMTIPKTLGGRGQKIELTPEELDGLRNADLRATNRLRELDKSPSFQRLSPETKKRIFERVHNNYRDAARRSLWSSKTLRTRAAQLVRESRAERS